MRELELGRVYRHYKGDLYVVEALAYGSEHCGKMVVYRALYGDGRLWVWPYDDFMGKVTGAEQDYRFELQDLQSKSTS